MVTCCYTQVTFRAPAELQIWHAASYSPPAWLGSAHYPLLYHLCLFVHIPIPDPVPHTFHVSDVRLFHVLRPRSPIHSTSHHIPLILFLFPLLFPTLCLFPMTLICSLRYLYAQNFMYVSSVWNWHRLSLLNSPLSIPNLPNLCLSKLRTKEHWVAKHHSLSRVLVKPCHWPC